MPPTIRADMSTGDRIAVWRVYRGMTQEACAGLVGKSLSYWKKIESGVRRVEKLSDLILIAQVLKVRDLTDLTGPLEFPLSRDRGPAHPVADALGATMLRASSPALDSGYPAVDVPAGLASAQRTFHTHRTPIAAVGGALPDLILAATGEWRRADTVPDRRVAAGLLSQAYVLTCRVLRHVSAYELAWMAVDRATLFAYAADDPVRLVWTAWQSSGVLKDTGRAEEGFAQCQDALALLRPMLDRDATDERVALFGELSQQAALMAAFCSNEGTALRYQDDGARAYSQVSDGYRDPMTGYGRDGQAWAAVWIPNALGKHRTAVAAAERIDIGAITSRPFAAWWWIRAARGYTARREDVAALHVLRQAVDACPESVAASADVREMCRDMMRRDRKPIARDLHDFARRIGIFT